MSNIYIWADTHFNHRGIIRHAKRRFKGVKDMNDSLVDRWNDVVRNESDVVYHLGDFGFHAPTDDESDDLGILFWRLRGVKHLLIGNHDMKNSQVLRLPWSSINDLLQVKAMGRRAVLCHYPLESWNGMHRGSLMFHGHCHGNLERTVPHRYDLGVDVLGHEGPVAWEWLGELADQETFVAVDHHGR